MKLCGVFFFSNSWKSSTLTLTRLSEVSLSVYIPLRKQCQAVEGQEWDQAMSSSSEKDEDIEKTPDSDSLLACYK